MLMSDGECNDSMFDIDCLLAKDAKLGLGPSDDPFLHHDDEDDPFRAITNAMRANVDRQASLEDLAHVIRADSHLSTAPNGITDAADTIQDLAKYLKDDSRHSPGIVAGGSAFGFASSSAPPPPPPPTPNHHQYAASSPDSDHAPMHNYARSRAEEQPARSAGNSALSTASYRLATASSRYPAVLIKQERPDTPEDSPQPASVRPAIQNLVTSRTDAAGRQYSVVYSAAGAGAIRRKRPIIYKEELPEEEDEEGAAGQERDGNLPPPRKYVRKNPKQIKDMEEYRKRRERNNEAVRRARAKKRQTEALIHSENRQLRAENQRLSTQLEAARLQMQTQERVIQQLRSQLDGPANVVQPQRIKKAPRRLSPC